jgi:hypothetical protein
MSLLINNLKRDRINKLSQEYNNKFKAIIIAYNTTIRNINRARVSFSLKRQQITEERNKLSNNLNSLRLKLNNDINTIINEGTTPITYLNKKALLIGINYNDTSHQLNGCIEDTNSMNKFLESKGYSNIKKLTDETEIKPTRENIINEITELLKTSEDGDLIFIYYSGHGSYVLDANEDELDKRDEVIVPLDFNVILDDELKSIINNNMKQKTSIIAVFDCCNSGTALDLRYQCLERLNFDSITENQKNEETPGNVIFISGCRDEQVSIELNINGKTQGAMTWALLNVLNKTPNISWRNLVKNVRGILRYTSYQVPQLSCGKLFNIDNVVVV